ncbi:MAG TPA: cupredoxin domain-containing protein [Candidatus Limnocylindrales bacterium]|nr:cupredoxin domain-containing protein [Candidatus Limnocylindrales bacterium]
MPRLPRRLGPARFAACATIAVAFLLAACSSAQPGASAPAGTIDPNAPELLAHGLMFDKTELDIPGGQPFQLVLDNDDGVPHNIAIYRDEGHSQLVFRGDIESTGIHVYQVQAIEPGTYYFQCDVHPQMNGIVVAGQG